MNEDIQNCDEVDTTNAYHILEGEARAKFRKWDNVKYITEIPKSRSRAKKSYSNKNWGMEIKTIIDWILKMEKEFDLELL